MLSRFRLKIIIYIFVLVILLLGLFFWHLYDLAKIRDYERLADMKILQSEFTEYFQRFNTYKVPECQVGSLVNFCTGKNGQGLKTKSIIDPTGSGYFNYLVNALSEDDFMISFSLETGIGGLSRGAYVLTKNGISK